MRHSYFGKSLSRSKNERTALRRNLMRSLILHGAIKTSRAKAQAVRSEIEKLITKAKKDTEAKRRDILSHIPDRTIVSQLIEMSKTRFAGRNSGYTRIVKLGVRAGDATELVLLSFVDEEVKQEVIKPGKEMTKKKGKSEKGKVKAVTQNRKSRKAVTK